MRRDCGLGVERERWIGNVLRWPGYMRCHGFALWRGRIAWNRACCTGAYRRDLACSWRRRLLLLLLLLLCLTIPIRKRLQGILDKIRTRLRRLNSMLLPSKSAHPLSYPSLFGHTFNFDFKNVDCGRYGCVGASFSSLTDRCSSRASRVRIAIADCAAEGRNI